MSKMLVSKHRDYLSWENELVPGKAITWLGRNQHKYTGQIVGRCITPGDYKIRIIDHLNPNVLTDNRIIDPAHIEHIVGVDGIVFADLEEKARWIRLAIFQFLSMNWGARHTIEDILNAVMNNDICKGEYVTDIYVELFELIKRGIVEVEKQYYYLV